MCSKVNKKKLCFNLLQITLYISIPPLLVSNLPFEKMFWQKGMDGDSPINQKVEIWEHFLMENIFENLCQKSWKIQAWLNLLDLVMWSIQCMEYNAWQGLYKIVKNLGFPPNIFYSIEPDKSVIKCQTAYLFSIVFADNNKFWANKIADKTWQLQKMSLWQIKQFIFVIFIYPFENSHSSRNTIHQEFVLEIDLEKIAMPWIKDCLCYCLKLLECKRY